MLRIICLFLFILTFLTYARAEIVVQSDVLAEVYLDGVKLGDSPMRILNAKPGYRSINLRSRNQFRSFWIYETKDSSQNVIGQFRGGSYNHWIYWNIYDCEIGIVQSYEFPKYRGLLPFDPILRDKYRGKRRKN